MRVRFLAVAAFFGLIQGLIAQQFATEYAEGRVLVKFRNSSVFAAFLQSSLIGARPAGTVQRLGVTRVVLAEGTTVEEAVRFFKSLPTVEFAEPDYIAQTTVVPNDQHYGLQWGLPKISAPAAWDYTIGLPTVPVAVLDTGYDQGHPDLMGKVVLSKDFTVLNGSANTVQDGNGHGTHTAGTVGSLTNNAIGVASIGWSTPLMVGKVLGDNGSGYHSEIADGIIWAADNGAKVINMSLGGSSGSTTLSNACTYAWNKGVVIVASAGNNGNTRPNYPAYYSVCIAVAATDQNDRRASFSTYGSWVDCAAPGVSIASTYPGGYAYMSGTSMAGPHVAGLAALVWTRYGTSNSVVRDRVVTLGDPVSSGFGRYPTKRINALRSVQ